VFNFIQPIANKQSDYNTNQLSTNQLLRNELVSTIQWRNLTKHNFNSICYWGKTRPYLHCADYSTIHNSSQKWCIYLKMHGHWLSDDASLALPMPYRRRSKPSSGFDVRYSMDLHWQIRWGKTILTTESKNCAQSIVELVTSEGHIRTENTSLSTFM